MALATRTFSRAAPRSSPHFQLSQCAHDCVAPSDQPLRRSNSAIRHQPAVIGRVEVAGQLGDLRFEFADRQAAVRSVLGGAFRGVLWGVFHGRTDTVFMYSIVANSQPFSSEYSTKTPGNIDYSRVPEPARRT